MKNNLGKSFLFFVYILSASLGYSQNKTIDSLMKVLQSKKDDTSKVNTLYALCEEFRYNQMDYVNALKYAEEGLSLTNKIGFVSGKATGYFNLGRLYNSLNQYPESNKYLDTALSMFQKINDEKNIAKTFLWLGYNYYDQALYSDALGNFNKSLNLFRELNDRKNMAEAYLRIGYCYDQLDSFGDASTSEYEALKLFETMGDKEQIGNTLQIIGLNYMSMNDDSDALKNLQAGLKLRSELNIRADMAQSMTVLGSLYTKMGNYADALKYDSASLKIFKELITTAPWGIPMTLYTLGQNYQKMGERADASGNKNEAGKNFHDALTSFQKSLKYYEGVKNEGTVALLNNELGFTMIRLNNYSDARSYFSKGLKLTKNSGYNNIFRDSYLGLSILDSISGNYKQSYLNYKKYIVYRDSLVNEETTKKSQQAKMLYESGKNEEMAKAAELKRKAEEQAERNLQLTAIAVFIPIFFLGVLLLSRTKVKSRIVEFLGILSLLLFFEFITDLIYPYVSKLTNENPIWEMLFLVSLAALLEPLNFKLEHWVKGHLVHKPVPVPIPLTVEDSSYDVE
jgi:tetratricopeptide (TPR) repeat protein